MIKLPFIKPKPAKPDPASAQAFTWQDAFKAYLQPVMLVMLALGFASGLPYMMVFQKMSFWLREVGIERSTIGFFYWVTAAYSLKFVWAPIVDRIPLPGLTEAMGHRRSWMLLAISGTIIGMLICGFSDPSTNLMQTVIGALILSFSGATLDISVDAWRIESAPNEEQAHMAAVYTLGYRFAIMASGLALAIAEWVSWPVAFISLAVLMGLNILTLIFFVKEPPRASLKAAKSVRDIIEDYIVLPFASLVARLGKWILPVLLLVAFYRVSDFTMGVMAYPLYADLNFSKQAVGLISSGFGVWITIFGAMIGGLFVVRYGLMRSMLLGAVITMITTAVYAWLSVQPEPLVRDLFFAIAADNLAGGFAATVFIAYLSSLVDKRYTATQYAFLSSLYSFFLKFISGFSGVFVDAIGYKHYFLLTASYCIPIIILILVLMRFGPPLARGLVDVEADRDET